MDPDLEALVRRHALSASVAAELDALWSGASASTAPTIGMGEGSGSDLAIAPPDLAGEQRYEDLGPLGKGGMAEVRRVRDRVLNRTLAMKIVHASFLRHAEVVSRFVEEARATAQLQHPGIVPVHDLGRLDDGRVWFTMQEVRGRTLSKVVREVHAASGERWEVSETGWGLHRVITAFHAVCQAVAFAHEHGVVHRDLKPQNVMVGRHGEVYVLDWGVAKILGRSDDVGSDVEVVQSARSADHATQAGQVAGTPAFMPPEQAWGEIERIDARSDVYALGSILYQILTGHSPYTGSAREVLQAVRMGPPVPVSRVHARLPLPAELVVACERAMSREPEGRFPSAAALAEAVQQWLDGSRRREEALARVERARAAESDSALLEAQAVALRAESEALLAGVAGWEPEERKAGGWEKAAEADHAEIAARLKDIEVDETLKSAFAFAPDLTEAHARLAQRYWARHAEAERVRDRRGAAEARTLLETHAAALPPLHPLRREVDTWLGGEGALTLHTDPPGAEVLLYRYVEQNRRLVEVFERSLGVTPLDAVTLPMGSYVCVLRHPACDEVRYPVEVVRQGHWDGVPPRERAPRAVPLPPLGTLTDSDVYVPPGWFRYGGSPGDPSVPMGRAWCDGFVIDRYPVTNAHYLRFLDDLVTSGREEDAFRLAPRERGGADGEPGALVVAFDGGRFSLGVDHDGDVWRPDFPAILVDWNGAVAYLAWASERTGRALRLPIELEWEKAARGVDGRWYPWGDAADPSWARALSSARGRPHGDFGPVEVDRYPVDCSPYGVRGLGGNVQDWCLNAFDPPPRLANERVVVPEAPGPDSLRATRGGAWDIPARSVVARFRLGPAGRDPSLGFRGVWRWPDA
ncbi:MAG: SUMF1/EgtB/PvdO family nonheme iron enzyme [Alphaproteobacteria bacterium]|nr:SUMF1/EgtB/PvdO family nonheme iron enzyme [Alphaproteobacteria bacterium]